MIDIRKVINKSTGALVSGYTLEAHTWVDGNAMADYDSGTLIDTYTDSGGEQTLDIATTVKAVLILKNSSGTQLQKIPSTTNGAIILEGDNRPDIEP